MLKMAQWEEELNKLDELLVLLASAPPSPESAIAQEHIQSARSCVLEAMPNECEFDLKLARTAVRQITDAATRRQALGILSGLAKP